MKIVSQSHEIIGLNPEIEIYKICRGYCKCYDLPVPDTYEEQCEKISRLRYHGSPIEHGNMTVDFVTNRGVSHELVRHRLMAVSQTSTRYCNYSKDRFDNQLSFILDSSVSDDDDLLDIWMTSRKQDEIEYFKRLESGQHPEQARGCLPNDLVTKLQITANLREWHHIFDLRCGAGAHYQMRELMVPLLQEVRDIFPCIFDDLRIPEDCD